MKRFSLQISSVILSLCTLLPLNFAHAGWMGQIDLMVREEVSFYFYETHRIEVDMYEDVSSLSWGESKDLQTCHMSVEAQVEVRQSQKEAKTFLCQVCFFIDKDPSGVTTAVRPIETSCSDKVKP